MSSVPLARPDALHYWSEFEKIVEAETDQRRRALLEFISRLSFDAVNKANAAGPHGGVVTLDMRGVATLANCLFDQQRILLDILTGEICEEDWSS
jgi:hypothetical protein